MATRQAREYVIVRTRNAGVHCGILMRYKGQEVELHNARRVWRWVNSALTLHEMATTGICHAGSRVSVRIPKIILLDAIEIIPTTTAARISLEEAVWTP